MAEPVMWKSTAIIPTSILGRDDAGRMLVRCPSCGDTATVMDDGEIRCPLDEALRAAFLAALGGADADHPPS
jgi:hypothetical protein